MEKVNKPQPRLYFLLDSRVHSHLIGIDDPNQAFVYVEEMEKYVQIASPSIKELCALQSSGNYGMNCLIVNEHGRVLTELFEDESGQKVTKWTYRMLCIMNRLEDIQYKYLPGRIGRIVSLDNILSGTGKFAKEHYPCIDINKDVDVLEEISMNKEFREYLVRELRPHEN